MESKGIPLLDDVSRTFKNVDIYDYFDQDMIFMYNVLNGNISDDLVYKYIKFINYTCLPASQYDHILKYINEDNINTFGDLFENIDIVTEIIPLLDYEIASKYSSFHRVKELWIMKNFEWVYDNLQHIKEFRILDVNNAFNHHNEYYKIGGKVYILYPGRLRNMLNLQMLNIHIILTNTIIHIIMMYRLLDLKIMQIWQT